MADDTVSIFNLALNAIGTRDNVAAPSEASREAEVCRLWFGPSRDHVLRAAPWASAKAFSRLAVLAERDETLAWELTDPEPGFRFAYAAPEDMLAPRYLSTFGRFTLGIHGDSKALMTQEETTILVYTKKQENIGLWDVHLKMAIVHTLAAFIAMPLTGKLQRAKMMEDKANALIYQARESNANIDDNQYDTVPDWLLARGYAGVTPSTRYYYPYGPMISVSEASAVA